MVYVISDGTGYVKIGIANDLKKRLKELQIGNPRDLSVVRLINTRDDASTEYCIHAMLEKFRVRLRSNVYHAEWFSDECLSILNSLTDEQLWHITIGLHWRYTKATPLPAAFQNPPVQETKIITQNQVDKLEREISQLRAENKRLEKELEEEKQNYMQQAKKDLLARLRAV